MIVFLSKGEGNENLVRGESEEYHKAYLNAMMDFQKKYNLRSRNVLVDPPKMAPEGHTLASQQLRICQAKKFNKGVKKKIFQKRTFLKKKTCRRMT